jgi:aspartyl-tRNA(Asn)/glutamyl-tRNA(Gln) amidotransferase subunit C
MQILSWDGKDKGMAHPAASKKGLSARKKRRFTPGNTRFPLIKKRRRNRIFRYFCQIRVRMEVTDALVDKLANLARLSFSPAEKAEIREDLSRMIGFVDQLNSVDTTGIEPLMHMSDEVNRLRDDVPGGSIGRADALGAAQGATDQYFTVPKVIQK